MSQTVHLGKRELALLEFLEVTPATAVHILKASVTFRRFDLPANRSRASRPMKS